MLHPVAQECQFPVHPQPPALSTCLLRRSGESPLLRSLVPEDAAHGNEGKITPGPSLTRRGARDNQLGTLPNFIRKSPYHQKALSAQKWALVLKSKFLKGKKGDGFTFQIRGQNDFSQTDAKKSPIPFVRNLVGMWGRVYHGIEADDEPFVFLFNSIFPKPL